VRNRKARECAALEAEVAGMLASPAGEANARIRVEELIRQEMVAHAYTRLETYLLLVRTRAEMLKAAKEPPPDMTEAVCSLLFAADRVRFDLDEVPAIRDILLAKFRGALCDRFGRAFAKEVVEEYTAEACGVSADVVAYLAASPADGREKLERLTAVAKARGVASYDEASHAAALMPANRRMPPAPSATAAAPPPPPQRAPERPAPAQEAPPAQKHAPAQQHAAKHAVDAQTGRPPVAPLFGGTPATRPPPQPGVPSPDVSSWDELRNSGWAPLSPARQTLGDECGKHLSQAAQWLVKERSGSVESGGGATPARGNSFPADYAPSEPGSADQSVHQRVASSPRQAGSESGGGGEHAAVEAEGEAEEEDDLVKKLRSLQS
jgi:hypothetical protein